MADPAVDKKLVPIPPTTSSAIDVTYAVDASHAKEVEMVGKKESVLVGLFQAFLDPDYQCATCQRAPLRPASIKCCGVTACAPCWEAWFKRGNNTTCPFCKQAAKLTDTVHAAYISSKLSGSMIRCPYARAPVTNLSATALVSVPISGGGEHCTWTGHLGKEGMRLSEHLASCPFVVEKCDECDAYVPRRYSVAHRGGGLGIDGHCKWQRVHCKICDVTMQRHSLASHEGTLGHLAGMLRSLAHFPTEVARLQGDVRAATTEAATLRKELEVIRAQTRVIATECDEKFAAVEARIDLK